MKKKTKQKQIPNYLKKDKPTVVAYIILRLFVLIALVAALFRQNYENVFVCVLTLLLYEIPALIERSFKIDLPTTLEVIVLLFIFAAEILGELQSYYVKFPYWDTMLHTVNGFLFAAFGFALVDIFNRNQKFSVRMSPLYLAIVAFCFSFSSVYLNPDGVNIPVVVDNIADTAVNGQSLGINGYLDIGLFDTMKDLIVNFIGAVIFSVIGFIYVKGREKGRGTIARQFIPIVLNDEDIQKTETLQAENSEKQPDGKEENRP